MFPRPNIHKNGLLTMFRSIKFFKFFHTQSPLCSQHDQTQSTKSKSCPTLRFIQYVCKNDEKIHLGLVSPDGTKMVDMSSSSRSTSDMVKFLNRQICLPKLRKQLRKLSIANMNDSLILLPPILNPGKIICVGLNYKDHCEEQKKPTPNEPIFFNKFSSAITGPCGDIKAHKMARRMDWEVELAVVIGKCGRNIPIDKTMDHVFGYTIAQDISSRDWQRRNGQQYLIAKSMDTFCPLGPCIVHKSLIDDVYDLDIITTINGVQKQKSNTKNLIFKIDYLINKISQFMTLCPGDIILTGTPGGVGMYRNPPEYLKVGDIVESHISCLGKLINKVIEVK